MKAMPLCKEDRRRGVALIIVLGFLSIMILMAVAFLTQARTERLVADSSLEGMRTRQVAQTAIAAAMQDYLNALKSVSQADTRHDIFLSGDGASLSFYFSGETIGDDRLLIGKVEDWLLDKHLTAALGGGTDDSVQDAEWIWVRQQPGTRSRILGRYAYACFDMSGLIDANLLGTAYGDDVPLYGASTNRDNVRKMLLDAVSKSPATGGERQRKLNGHQRGWRGFDTPAALLNLTDGKVNDGDDDNSYNRWAGKGIEEDLVGGIEVGDLSPYSYSVLHKGEGTTEKIRCSASEIDSKGGSDFTAILAGANRDEVVKALKDYESTDTIPLGTDYPSVKNLPMFNEIGVQVELKETAAGTDTNGLPASTYALLLHMKIEFWYPFPSAKNRRNELFSMAIPTIGGSKSSTGDKDIWVQLAGNVGGARTEIAMGTASTDPAVPLSVAAKFNDNSPYFAQNANADDELLYTVPLTKLNSDPKMPQGMKLAVRNVQISKPLVLELGGKPVDSMPTDKAIDLLTRVVPDAGIGNGEKSIWSSVAVSDPRLNHIFASWVAEDPPTFGDINQAAKDAASKVTDETPGSYLFCYNRPMLCPAEMGYLSSGIPWKTLNIFKDEGTWLMNRLVCDPNVLEMLDNRKAYYTNGTINPYTRDTNVLNAAFFGLDIREVPEMDGEPDGSAQRLGESNVKELVKAMMEEEAKKGYGGWTTILDNKNLMPDLNKNNLISIVRNTWGLFNESDRLFVVVVIAQSIKESDDEAGVGNWDSDEDMITGERRAVALCWMDGSAEGSADTLTQEMDIIMFQYLNE